ncbi:hypothetical protein CLV78_102148 [Aliiruegeria haliotis]|uniref:Uncharacterized protein n=1 Tax=Aliiruegeria haliotis TaxID=1280846 RepID=A0A2T0RUY7_9RHOB|nr:hypothetical protein CLV78_102148 [Aliiruegeria haliotis]
MPIAARRAVTVGTTCWFEMQYYADRAARVSRGRVKGSAGGARYPESAVAPFTATSLQKGQRIAVIGRQRGAFGRLRNAGEPCRRPGSETIGLFGTVRRQLGLIAVLTELPDRKAMSVHRAFAACIRIGRQRRCTGLFGSRKRFRETAFPSWTQQVPARAAQTLDRCPLRNGSGAGKFICAIRRWPWPGPGLGLR